MSKSDKREESLGPGVLVLAENGGLDEVEDAGFDEEVLGIGLSDFAG